jgi:hypothetical protein
VCGDFPRRSGRSVALVPVVPQLQPTGSFSKGGAKPVFVHTTTRYSSGKPGFGSRGKGTMGYNLSITFPAICDATRLVTRSYAMVPKSYSWWIVIRGYPEEGGEATAEKKISKLDVGTTIKGEAGASEPLPFPSWSLGTRLFVAGVAREIVCCRSYPGDCLLQEVAGRLFPAGVTARLFAQEVAAGMLPCGKKGQGASPPLRRGDRGDLPLSDRDEPGSACVRPSRASAPDTPRLPTEAASHVPSPSRGGSG